MDTPGLSDIEMRKKAAEEITKALKKNGKYYLFFVVTLDVCVSFFFFCFLYSYFLSLFISFFSIIFFLFDFNYSCVTFFFFLYSYFLSLFLLYYFFFFLLDILCLLRLGWSNS
jgi:hypothetical protein